MMESGEEVFITIKAPTEAEASVKVHTGDSGYKGVEYVLDILTPAQLEARKKHLRRSIVGGVAHY